MYEWWIFDQSTRGSKKFVRAEHNSNVENDFFKNSRFATANSQFVTIRNILLKEPSVNLLPLAYIYIYIYIYIDIYLQPLLDVNDVPTSPELKLANLNFVHGKFWGKKTVNITGGKCLVPWPAFALGDEFGISVTTSLWFRSVGRVWSMVDFLGGCWIYMIYDDIL